MPPRASLFFEYEQFGISTPRPITSVATKILYFPSRNLFSAVVRSIFETLLVLVDADPEMPNDLSVRACQQMRENTHRYGGARVIKQAGPIAGDGPVLRFS